VIPRAAVQPHFSNTIDTAEHGADDNVKIEGEVSLHAVAEDGEIDVVKSLLERGVL
jgi:hypothetical protein